MNNFLKIILVRGAIVVGLVSLLLFFKMLPGWIVEREIKRQLSLLPSPAAVKKTPLSEQTVNDASIPKTEFIFISKDEIYTALQVVKDPELDINVVDLGLIQDIHIDRNGIAVSMILTTRFCPYQGRIVSSVKEAVKRISGQSAVTVNVDYSKKWSVAELTDEGKKQWHIIFSKNTGDK